MRSSPRARARAAVQAAQAKVEQAQIDARLHEDHLADRRHRRRREGAGRRPGGPDQLDAAHHRLAGRPDPRRHADQRARLPALRGSDPRVDRAEPGDAGGRARSARARARRRQRAPPQGPRRGDGPRGGSDHGHDRAQERVPESRTSPCGPGQYARVRAATQRAAECARGAAARGDRDAGHAPGRRGRAPTTWWRCASWRRDRRTAATS